MDNVVSALIDIGAVARRAVVKEIASRPAVERVIASVTGGDGVVAVAAIEICVRLTSTLFLYWSSEALAAAKLSSFTNHESSLSTPDSPVVLPGYKVTLALAQSLSSVEMPVPLIAAV